MKKEKQTNKQKNQKRCDNLNREKAFGKILNPFWIKALIKPQKEENILNLKKGIYKTYIATTIFTSGRQCSPPKKKNKAGMCLFITFIQHCTGDSSLCNVQ